jgi:hypothetical protein
VNHQDFREAGSKSGMKNITKWLTILGLTLGVSAPASAAFIETSWTDTHWAHTRLTSCGFLCNDVYRWRHDISDGANGYRPGKDFLGDAFLTIWLSDDNDTANERADIDLGSFFGGGGSFDFSRTFNSFEVSFFGWLDLALDGRITLYIDPTAGDFWYNGSQLNATGWRNATGTVAVPEPGTLALLAIGLIGMGVALSRRRNQK